MSENQVVNTAEASPASSSPATQPAQGAQAAQNAGARTDGRTMLPRVDVLEDEAGITLLADLPGVPRDQLEVKVEGETLLIDASVASRTADRLEPVYAEVRIPRYRRAFTLSRELDGSRVEANLKDGVLKLRIPKQAHAQPRRIEVQVG